MEEYYKLKRILNEFDNRLINKISCVVEEDFLHYDKETKIYRIIEYCLSNDSKKSKDLQEILFAYAEKYTNLLEEFNAKKDQMLNGATESLEVFIKANWNFQ